MNEEPQECLHCDGTGVSYDESSGIVVMDPCTTCEGFATVEAIDNEIFLAGRYALDLPYWQWKKGMLALGGIRLTEDRPDCDISVTPDMRDRLTVYALDRLAPGGQSAIDIDRLVDRAGGFSS